MPGGTTRGGEDGAHMLGPLFLRLYASRSRALIDMEKADVSLVAGYGIGLAAVAVAVAVAAARCRRRRRYCYCCCTCCLG